MADSPDTRRPSTAATMPRRSALLALTAGVAATALSFLPSAARGADLARRSTGAAAAVEPTRRALNSYSTWLHFERQAIQAHLYPNHPCDRFRVIAFDNDGSVFHADEGFATDRAVTRAGIILPLIGLDPREVAR